MGRPEAAALPERAAEPHGDRSPVRRLFARDAAGATVRIWASFFLLMYCFYFVTSWTPKLLVEAGLSTRQGITGGVLLNLGGIAGGVLFGSLVASFPLRRLTCLNLAGTAAGLLLFGWLATDLKAAFAIALMIGVFLFGSMVGLYAATPLLYPAGIRATGMGWAIGIGRLGAILAPVVAGWLVDRGWETPSLYAVFAVPPALAVLSVRALRV
jgi:MFS family permease